ncbi:nuclear valosin-containing protein-like [Macrobrachium nipponense]|uniref:nuclear valosin-containing protein-like n=1 Tax=Macrobrachium nipponense TaxID=159736 RepID=UPI0030C8C0EB
MKRPYLQEKSLLPRIASYVKENKNVDIDELTDYLMENFKEFHNKVRHKFMSSVEKAYLWHIYNNPDDIPDSEPEEIIDSDGGGPDILEVTEVNDSMNETLKNMYKSKSSTPRRNDRNGVDQFRPDNDRKGTRKKKKRVREEDIEEAIIKKKKKQKLPEQSPITFEKMAGIDSLKDKICDLIANIRRPSVLQPLQKSVLVTGPTGSGKTTFGFALAGTAEALIYRITSSELFGGPTGDVEGKLNEIFEQAASLAPCVILIEKIDLIAPKDGSAKSLEKRISVQLSSCLSALKAKYKDQQIIVIGETSHPENMDWDLRSSFDAEIFMAIPSEAARYEVLQLLCQDVNYEGDLEELAHRTPGYVAGDLKRLIEKAQSLAWKSSHFLTQWSFFDSVVWIYNLIIIISHVISFENLSSSPYVKGTVGNTIFSIVGIFADTGLTNSLLKYFQYQGESERAVREVFRRAGNVAPCVIFFDEFDSLCPIRTKGGESGSKTTIVNTLLTEMNGFAKRDDVYVIAATNRPDILDPAVTRPGRFDTLLYVDVPDYLGRISIFKARTKNGTCPALADDVSFEEISQVCNNFSGADCDQLVYLASKEAIREVIQNMDSTGTDKTLDTSKSAVAESAKNVKRLVSKKHFFAALKKMKPSISVEEQKRYKKLYNKICVSPNEDLAELLMSSVVVPAQESNLQTEVESTPQKLMASESTPAPQKAIEDIDSGDVSESTSEIVNVSMST